MGVLDEFESIAHRIGDLGERIYEIGEHVVSFMEGGESVMINGREVDRDDLVQLVKVLLQAGRILGVVPESET